MEDEEVKSVVMEAKKAKSSESSLTYPKRYKLKLKAKVSERAIDGEKVIEIFPKGYNELKLKVYSRIRENMDKRKKEEIEGKPKVRKMRTKRKRNILRERLNLPKADERGMGMLSILMLMEREAIKVKEKSYKRMDRALRQAASRRKAREAAKTEEKLEEERIKQEIIEHIVPPKVLKDEGEDYAPKIKAVIRRKIIKAKQKRQPKRNYIDKVLKIIRAKAKHQQSLDETGIDFLKSSPKTYEQTVDQFYEKIVEKIKLTNLLKLEKIFWINDYVMTKEKLINAFKDMRPPTEVTAIDLFNLFIKLDKKNTGTITWFQFLYHLHLEIEQLLLSKHANMFADMFPPINGKPKYINPKFPGLVVAIGYCPYLKRAKYFSYTYGKYVTVNKYGQVTFWNLDMEPERSGQIEFHISGPLVTDIAYLADFQQIAFSTNDANLRIYDITAGRFQMSLMVEQFPRTILKLHYKFFAAEDEPSVLFCGLGNGSVVMIHFFATDGSPFMFKSSNGIVDTVVLSYDNLMCGRFPYIRIIEVKTLHNEPIMQMQLFPRTDTLITCCNSSVRSVAMIKYSTVQIRRSIDVPGGVSCFCVISRKKLIITGGLDKKIRVWHLTEEFPPIMILAGHTSAITFIAQIYGGRRIYTIALNKNVKVWDFYSREAIMTFDIDFTSSAKNKPFAICYNPYYRTLLVAEWKIGIIKFGYSINYKMCEGITHTKPVTAVLYNAIFEQIVTCGMDSRIFFWKSFTGEKLLTVNKAHIRRSYNEGEEVVSGITTAQFGPKYLFLFTGALDGTIRMWDTHYALCVRVVEFKTDCPITSITCVDESIIITGWNKTVKMWDIGLEGTDRKIMWKKFHTDDILTSCLLKPTQTLITANYKGELAFSYIPATTAYKMYYVSSPAFEVDFGIDKLDWKNESSDEDEESCKQDEEDQCKCVTLKPIKTKEGNDNQSENTARKSFFQSACANSYCVERYGPERIGITCVIGLNNRPCRRDVGSVVVALQTGWIQIWSHSVDGGLLEEFYTLHSQKSYVLSMATDSENRYLFTGFTYGYIKVWYIENYVYPRPEGPKKVCWPLLRLKFPFLISSSKLVGRVKRSVRKQPEPKLIGAFRGHLKAVSSMVLIELHEVLVTASHDHTVRYWTYGGLYLGTLGGKHKLPTLIQGVTLKIKHPRVPRDLRRVASSTTLHVMNNAYEVYVGRKFAAALRLKKFKEKIKSSPLSRFIYPDNLKKPILGKYFATQELYKSFDVYEDLTFCPPEKLLASVSIYDVKPVVKDSPPDFVKESYDNLIKECHRYLEDEELTVENIKELLNCMHEKESLKPKRRRRLILQSPSLENEIN